VTARFATSIESRFGYDGFQENIVRTKSRPKFLVKESVAEQLRNRIVSGAIVPGQPIVEGKWAAQLGVAQASVREALNILIREGYVQKTAGRRARVTIFAKADVQSIYEVRASLEGLAARLVVERGADLNDLSAAIEEMQEAASNMDLRKLVNADLRFHLLLAEKSGNRFLLEHVRKILIPLFAFVLMRVNTNRRGPEPWQATLTDHRRILEGLRLGDPVLAEQILRHATIHFAATAFEDWEHA
jgi:DNA-binding GntR family transcriptional regulator